MKITHSFTPKNAKAWRAWLQKNHARETEIWLVYYKPSSGKVNIDYETSVEEALCFGWIDSIIQRIDDAKYARKFNPRREKSQWSETNKRRVRKVIREGRMTAAGMARVSFDVKRREEKPVRMKRPPVAMPPNIEKAIRSKPGLWDEFEKLAPSLKRNYILWLMNARKPETFDRRLNKMTDEVLTGRATVMH